MYDIFFVSKGVANEKIWNDFHDIYPLSVRLDNVNSINDIKEKTFTKMFWIVWDDVILDENFDLKSYRATKWDDMYVHIFKNKEWYDGVCLIPRQLEISKKEFDHRFFTDKKEVEIEISVPRQYEKFFIKNYDEYLHALKTTSTEMFWVIWPGVEIIDDSIFNNYFSHHDAYNRSENHIYKNLCNSESSYYNGIVLFSKHKPISKKEFDRRYLINKKEHDRIVSRYRYPRYIIETYQQYLDILNKETQPLFWCIWPEIDVTNNEIFDMYFDPRDGKYDHDRKENHSFKHLFKQEETYANGITLFSTSKKIGKREFDHRFLIEKKEHNIIASKFSPYDIVFISYNEPNADENYSRLLEKFPRAKRVDKVKGIHQAHIKAAELCQTEMFWVVDGDAVIVEDFNFDHETSTYERDIVHVWRSKNPINELVYGYGGVKLLPKKLTIEMDVDTPDMTTAISKKFKAMPSVSNITAFDTDPFNTWKSAFRECVKLSSRLIDRQDEKETKERLDVWCSIGRETAFGEYAIRGAVAGRCYGEENKNDREKLKLINDFTWLKAKFDEI